MTGSADNAQETRHCEGCILENTPNFRCQLPAVNSGRDRAQNMMTSAATFKMIGDGKQQKSKAAHIGKHTQPFSTVTS